MYDEKWEQTFLLLQDFVKEYGRFPTARESYQGVNIGRWYVYQRNKMQSSTLPPEQQEKLDALKQGDFTSPPLQSQWDKTYQRSSLRPSEIRRYGHWTSANMATEYPQLRTSGSRICGY